MTLIRPSPVENLYITLFQLEADRPKYYIYIVRLARSIFISLGFNDKVTEMKTMIRKYLEKPLKSEFVSIVHAYDNPKFAYSKRAYTKIGDSLDYKEMTRYELENRLEIVKNWIFDEVTKLSSYIRFTRSQQMMA
jgi:hypothetical protein